MVPARQPPPRSSLCHLSSRKVVQVARCWLIANVGPTKNATQPSSATYPGESVTSSPIQPVGFALWNTRLCPPSTSSSVSNSHLELVQRTLEQLTTADGNHLLAFTEVRRQDMRAWLTGSQNQWEIVQDTSGDQHDFDVALLLDRSALTLAGFEFLKTFHEGALVRAGLLCRLLLADGSPLVVVVAHWRSDLAGSDEGRARRDAAAHHIKTAIARSIDLLGGASHVLVLGDFNAEPYDPVFRILPTSRNRGAVLRHRQRTSDDLLLYNPSWRWLGERTAWTGVNVGSLAGTYCDGKGLVGSWRTFDQVLVSKSLLATTGWFLREDLTGVYTSPLLMDRITGKLTNPIDHLPVTGKMIFASTRKEPDLDVEL